MNNITKFSFWLWDLTAIYLEGRVWTRIALIKHPLNVELSCFKGKKVFTIELVECLQTLFFPFPCSARYFPSSIIKLQNNKNYLILILHLTFKCTKVNTCVLPMATYIMSNVCGKVLFGVQGVSTVTVIKKCFTGTVGKIQEINLTFSRFIKVSTKKGRKTALLRVAHCCKIDDFTR